MSSAQEDSSISQLPEVINPFEVFSILSRQLFLMRYHLNPTLKQKTSSGGGFLRNFFNPPEQAEIVEDSIDVTGEAIAQQFSVKKMHTYVQQLKEYPLNTSARLSLIEPFATKGIQGNLLICRDVLLHAMFEVEKSRISTHALNIAVLAQQRYLEKLASVFKETIGTYETELEGYETRQEKPETSLLSHIDMTKRIIRFFNEVIPLLKGKLIENRYEIHLDELSASPPKQKVAENLFSKPFDSIMILPLACISSQRMIEVFKEVAPQSPLGWFAECRMNRSRAKLLKSAYMAAHQNAIEPAVEVLNQGMACITEAIHLIGKAPFSDLEKKCLREYGLMSLITFQDIMAMGELPPKNHSAVMQDAIRHLEAIAEEPGISELQNALTKTLHQFQHHE